MCLLHEGFMTNLFFYYGAVSLSYFTHTLACKASSEREFMSVNNYTRLSLLLAYCCPLCCSSLLLLIAVVWLIFPLHISLLPLSFTEFLKLKSIFTLSELILDERMSYGSLWNYVQSRMSCWMSLIFNFYDHCHYYYYYYVSKGALAWFTAPKKWNEFLRKKKKKLSKTFHKCHALA
jgi:hypothetical protein